MLHFPQRTPERSGGKFRGAAYRGFFPILINIAGDESISEDDKLRECANKVMKVT
jgi:hypothetical protein